MPNISAFRQRLDESLFRDPPPPSPALRKPLWLSLVGILFISAVLLQMARVGWSAALHSLWAEDGAIYLSGAVHGGFGSTLFDTYATYLVFVPRAIAEVADLLPLRDAPVAISVLSAAVVALSGFVVWRATEGLIENRYLRGALVALTVLSPVAGLESTDSAAYVPWYMLFASFWILLWRPRTTAGAVFAGLFVLATGLSTPGLWFFIPFAILRVIALRDVRDAIVLCGFWVGALVQVPVLVMNHEPAVTPHWTHDIWTAYVQRVVSGAAFGLVVGGKAWVHLGWLFLIALLAIAFAALIWGVARSNFGVRLLAFVAIPTSLVMFAISLYQRALGSQAIWQPHNYAEAASRYAIVPALLLVSVALVMLDRRSQSRAEEDRPQWLAFAAVALFAIVIASSFDAANGQIRGAPPWEAALGNAARVCAREHFSEARVATSPPAWGLKVPCSQLLPARYGR